MGWVQIVGTVLQLWLWRTKAKAEKDKNKKKILEEGIRDVDEALKKRDPASLTIGFDKLNRRV